MVRTFVYSGEMLDKWRQKTAEMFPGRQDLLDMIPSKDGLELSKLHRAQIMTDTCNTARCVRSALKETIEAAARDKNIDESQIQVFVAECGHHLRNVCVKNALIHVDKFLSNLLEVDLGVIPSVYRVTCNMEKILIALEKEFAKDLELPKRSCEGVVRLA